MASHRKDRDEKAYKNVSFKSFSEKKGELAFLAE